MSSPQTVCITYVVVLLALSRTLFFNKNKLNKNTEAEIAQKIRTSYEQTEAEIEIYLGLFFLSRF